MPVKKSASKRSKYSVRNKPHNTSKHRRKPATSKLSVRRKRPLHRRIALHPLSIMAVLCAGVFIVGWSVYAVADNISISAKVSAPFLTKAAYITSPYENAVINSAPINVTGTCPEGSYVKLLRNGLFSGVAWCMPGNSFEITTDLFSGQNTLKVQDYNITDDPGPESSNVTVTYVPPAANSVPSSPQASASASPTTIRRYTSQSSAQSVKAVPAIFLGAGFHFSTVLPGSVYSATLQLNGGTPPYALSINWGDGSTTQMKLTSDPTFTISHSYRKAGYYAIIVNATDSQGFKSWLQLAALIREPGTVGFSMPTNTTSLGASNSSHDLIYYLGEFPAWLKIAWPSFAVVCLMLFSFWLGERQEYHLIRSKHLRA